jgi:6-pyruvoyltetrahydropterin/6-carboxytetrahydropterin synthase
LAFCRCRLALAVCVRLLDLDVFYLDYQLDDFSAAHRLVKGYKGPCAHLHGHNYRVAVRIEAKDLQDNNMLVDFSDIKRICNQWVQDHLDHGTLICSEDKELQEFVKRNQQKHFVFPNGDNTTCEALSHVIFYELQKAMESCSLFANRTRLISITVNESPRASASFCPRVL